MKVHPKDEILLVVVETTKYTHGLYTLTRELLSALYFAKGQYSSKLLLAMPNTQSSSGKLPLHHRGQVPSVGLIYFH